jgi:choline-glycine betaine transporter
VASLVTQLTCMGAAKAVRPAAAVHFMKLRRGMQEVTALLEMSFFFIMFLVCFGLRRKIRKYLHTVIHSPVRFSLNVLFTTHCNQHLFYLPKSI